MFFNQATQALEEKLEALFPQELSSLNPSARYALSPPAKRIRPLLLMTTGYSYGACLEDTLLPACALEMIHTYSLIHDDLPCMDDDDLRRGKPSLHKAFPQWQALLTGDYLLTFAFELLAQSPLDCNTTLELIRIFSKEAGVLGMIGGQAIDLSHAHHTISDALLEEMHSKKTAALLVAALESGAVIAKAPLLERHTLKQIARLLGLAFQFMDDLLDATSTTEQLGKPALSDESKQKPTAVSLWGIDKTQEKIAQLHTSLFDQLHTLSCDYSLLETLIVSIFNRKS